MVESLLVGAVLKVKPHVPLGENPSKIGCFDSRSSQPWGWKLPVCQRFFEDFSGTFEYFTFQHLFGKESTLMKPPEIERCETTSNPSSTQSNKKTHE